MENPILRVFFYHPTMIHSTQLHVKVQAIAVGHGTKTPFLSYQPHPSQSKQTLASRDPSSDPVRPVKPQTAPAGHAPPTPLSSPHFPSIPCLLLLHLAGAPPTSPPLNPASPTKFLPCYPLHLPASSPFPPRAAYGSIVFSPFTPRPSCRGPGYWGSPAVLRPGRGAPMD
jgi:hypothetical protein